MDTAKLQSLDMALVAVYLVSVTGLGLWLTRGVKTSRDYFLAGKSLPWWAVGMSLVVSDIGAKDMVGLAADGYRYGLVMMNFDFIGCAFPVLAAAFLFMPFLWIAGVYTVPEYLGRRYNSTVRTFFALIWAFFMMGTVGTILVSAAVMFEALLGWSFWWSVGITAVVVGIFTTIGRPEGRGADRRPVLRRADCRRRVDLHPGAGPRRRMGGAASDGRPPGLDDPPFPPRAARRPSGVSLARGPAGPRLCTRAGLLDRQPGDCPAHARGRQPEPGARRPMSSVRSSSWSFPCCWCCPA